MTLLVDTWAEHLATLTAQGWVVTDYSRYDPTAAAGLTPSGKAFTLSIVRQGAGGLVTLTIAGNTRTTTLANWEVDVEPGDATVREIRAVYLKFPGNQR